MDGHCPRCKEYEVAIMAGAAADGVEPCDHYEMTATFRDWLVGRMRDEVAAAVSGSGLDRMAIVRQKDD